MSAAVEEALAALATPAAFEDPYPVYARLRELAPVYRSEAMGGWLLSRFADCQRVLADGAGFLVLDAAWQDAHNPGWRDNPAMVMFTDMIAWKNPPAHTRERRLLTRDFTVRRVQGLVPLVRDAVGQALDRFADATSDGGAADFVDLVLYPLGMAVIGDLVGVPAAEHDRLRRATDMIGKLMDPAMPEDLRAQVNTAAADYRQFFVELIERRRAEPRDDLTSALVGKHHADPEEMSDADVLNSLLVLFGGGYETTAGALGNGLMALLGHPDQYGLLTADPSLAAAATEESLRWDGPAQLSQRAAVADTEFGDVTVPAGDVVIVLSGAANRDPERFPDPDRFDLTRADGRGLFFGHGLHLCLGAALARLEMTTVLEQVAERFPKLSLAGEPVRRANIALRGMAELPLTR